MNPSVAYIRSSDGSGDASLMTITQVRTAPATTITVNTVAGVPTNFFAAMGTPHTFNDPVTGETITIISEATAVSFAGRIDSGKVEIVAIAPGETDLGSKVGDIIIIRPTTEWANNLHKVLNESHNDDGTLKDSAIVYNANVFDHVASGAEIAGLGYGSNLNISISAGIVYINGGRYILNAVASKTLVASRDTYIDIPIPASGRTITNADIVYTDVALNAASPALAANRIRLGIVTAGANILNAGSVNQGQEDKLLPIVSSTPYAVTDSLGNLICPRDPGRRTLGLRTYKTSQGSISTEQDLTGLNLTINAPTNRKIKIKVDMHMFSTVGGDFYSLALKEGATYIREFHGRFQTNSGQEHFHFEHEFTPTPGAHTYKLALRRAAGSGGISTYNNATSWSHMGVELV